MLPVFSANIYNNTENIQHTATGLCILKSYVELRLLSRQVCVCGGGREGRYTYPATTVCLQKKQQKQEGRGDRKQSR